MEKGKMLKKIYVALLVVLIVNVLIPWLNSVKADGSMSIYDSMDADWQVSSSVGSSGHTHMEYSNTTYTSQPSSVLGQIWGTASDAGDYATLEINKTFAWVSGVPLTSLRLNYLVDTMTDGDSWGGMACHGMVKVIVHSATGVYEYSYIIAGGTIDDSGTPWAYYYCQDLGPNVKYINWTNEEIPAPGHGELEPPTGQWYALNRNVDADFDVDWTSVTDVEIKLVLEGGFLYLDNFILNFDDLYLSGPGEWTPCTLSVNSLPGNVDFKINGTVYSTPWMRTYNANSSVDIEMPENYTADSSFFIWDSWLDGNTSRFRTVILNDNVTLTGNYTFTPYPPSAYFTWYPEVPSPNSTVNFDASLSEPNGGTIVSYDWNFGDNETATGQTVAHSYPDPGNYTVTLNVTDSEGLWDVYEANITVMLYIEISSTPLGIQFMVNGSLCTTPWVGTYPQNTMLDILMPENCTIDSTMWYWGQWDDENQTRSRVVIMDTNITLSVNYISPPTANFTWTPALPKANDEVTFDASASVPNGGNITEYKWDFGDNGTALGIIVYHSFSESGNYTVTLNVTDSEGLFDLEEQNVSVRTPIHDVALLSITPSKTVVGQGYTVAIELIVENQGDLAETFNVSTYANSTLISLQVCNLYPYSNATLSFDWNTSGMATGTYVIRAEIPPVSGETDTGDNTLVDGAITLEIPKHDVATVDVETSPSIALPGSTVQVDVLIANLGNVRETFNVTAYANATAIGTITVTAMDFAETQTVIFVWNTTGYASGTYLISATAIPVPGETEVFDNDAADGTVTIVVSTPVVYVFPQQIYVRPNETFTVDICIFNVVGLRGWQTDLYFNNSILTCLGAPGRDHVFCLGFFWDAPFTGSCTLAQIHFQGLTEGTSYLLFSRSNTVLGDVNGLPIPCTALDGNVWVSQHDLCLKGGKLSKNVVGQGYCANYPLKVWNNGAFSEDFNITFCGNETSFQTQAVYSLNQSCSLEITCALNTSTLQMGYYTISATAGPIAGEARVSDNTATDGLLIVTIPGDVNGDFTVNILDAIQQSNAFLATPGSTNWNPNADINGDNVVNILDAIILANHFLQHYP